MEKIIELLKTPEFWFGTVIVGILGNIAAHVLIKYTGDSFAKLSKRWSTRNEKVKEEREKRITTLIDNPTEQQFFLSLATNSRIKSTAQMVFACAFFGFALYSIQSAKAVENAHASSIIYTVAIIVGLINTFVYGIEAVKNLTNAKKIETDLGEARERQRKKWTQKKEGA